jgi:hypothetical protein
MRDSLEVGEGDPKYQSVVVQASVAEGDGMLVVNRR